MSDDFLPPDNETEFLLTQVSAAAERGEIRNVQLHIYASPPRLVLQWTESQTKSLRGERLADVLQALLEHRKPWVSEDSTQPLPVRKKSPDEPTVPERSTDRQTQRVKASKDDKP